MQVASCSKTHQRASSSKTLVRCDAGGSYDAFDSCHFVMLLNSMQHTVLLCSLRCIIKFRL
jgi:hypothetical protein